MQDRIRDKRGSDVPSLPLAIALDVAWFGQITFEFNLKAAAGVHCFLGDDWGLACQYRFTHPSNEGIDYPNLGANTVSVLLGLS